MQEFEMTQEQLDTLLEASKPTRVMYFAGGKSMFNTPQENANQAWEKLGKELNFKYLTVKISNKGQRTFIAEPIKT